jgi:hypothetical protein
MALHEQCVGATDEWYTPLHVFDAMNTMFDIDVASPQKKTFVPAREFITADSLSKSWAGFVWMNPPFGKRNGLIPWLTKFVAHANGVCLVPDRTSAPWWQSYVPQMDLVLFVSPKIHFIDVNGNPGRSPAQGTNLCAIGGQGVEALLNASHNGLGVLFIPTIKLG